MCKHANLYWTRYRMTSLGAPACTIKGCPYNTSSAFVFFRKISIYLLHLSAKMWFRSACIHGACSSILLMSWRQDFPFLHPNSQARRFPGRIRKHAQRILPILLGALYWPVLVLRNKRTWESRQKIRAGPPPPSLLLIVSW